MHAHKLTYRFWLIKSGIYLLEEKRQPQTEILFLWLFKCWQNEMEDLLYVLNGLPQEQNNVGV